MPHIIAVSNQKGGVGKTTTAVNLAACLGEAGHPTLLVDMDPQGNATSGCGLDPNNLESSIYEALLDGEKPAVYPLGDEIVHLSVLPASMDLAGAEFELMDRQGREFALKQAIERLNGTFEYVIIDSPPSLGLLTLNALVAAKWVIIPCQAEYLALEGLSRMVLTIQRINRHQNPDLRILGILTTMFDGRTNIANQVHEELLRNFPNQTFQSPVCRSVRLSEAPSFGKPIVYYDPRSIGAEQYRHFSQEVIHACEKASIGPGA